jgi:hypothetical protein
MNNLEKNSLLKKMFLWIPLGGIFLLLWLWKQIGVSQKLHAKLLIRFNQASLTVATWMWIYIIIVNIFALIYLILGGEWRSPNGDIQLNDWKVLYFSVVTFNTVGFGDYFPLDDSARCVLMFESFLFILFNILASGFIASKILRRPKDIELGEKLLVEYDVKEQYCALKVPLINNGNKLVNVSVKLTILKDKTDILPNSGLLNFPSIETGSCDDIFYDISLGELSDLRNELKDVFEFYHVQDIKDAHKKLLSGIGIHEPSFLLLNDRVVDYMCGDKKIASVINTTHLCRRNIENRIKEIIITEDINIDIYNINKILELINDWENDESYCPSVKQFTTFLFKFEEFILNKLGTEYKKEIANAIKVFSELEKMYKQTNFNIFKNVTLQDVMLKIIINSGRASNELLESIYEQNIQFLRNKADDITLKILLTGYDYETGENIFLEKCYNILDSNSSSRGIVFSVKSDKDINSSSSTYYEFEELRQYFNLQNEFVIHQNINSQLRWLDINIKPISDEFEEISVSDSPTDEKEVYVSDNRDTYYLGSVINEKQEGEGIRTKKTNAVVCHYDKWHSNNKQYNDKLKHALWISHADFIYPSDDDTIYASFKVDRLKKQIARLLLGGISCNEHLEKLNKSLVEFKRTKDLLVEKLSMEMKIGGKYIYYRKFKVKNDFKVKSADLYFQVDDECEVFFNGNNLNKYYGVESFGYENLNYLSLMSPFLKKGENELLFIVSNIHSRTMLGKINVYGLRYCLDIEYAYGAQRQP